MSCAQATYAVAEQAFIKKDLDLLSSVLADSFHTVKGDKVTNRAEMMKMFGGQLQAMDTKSWPRRILSLTVSRCGTRAVSVAEGDFLFAKGGVLQPVFVTRSEDHWERQADGKWRNTKAVARD